MATSTLTPELQSSRRLPPAEAWKEPKKWIDIESGRALPDIEKLKLPVDDRRFVMTDKAVSFVLDSLFWPDYEWAYDKNDPQTRPDDHHFYFDEAEYAPSRNGGSFTPIKFRELPTVIGRMPRQLHNTFHDLTLKPQMPEIDDMANYVDSYELAYRAFKKLFETAKDTVIAQQLFQKRRRSIALGGVVPHDQNDSVAEAFMRSFFEEHFAAYSRAADVLSEIDNKDIVYPGELNINRLRPSVAVRKFGEVVTRRCVNYMPLIAGR